MEKVIYTLGTSNRAQNEFIGLLKKYQIDTMIDVRKFPTSKFEWFEKENLAEILSKSKIKYIYLGKELGGYRSSGYEAYTKCEEFIKGRKKVEDIAKDCVAAVVCSERLPWRCHRRFIARCLAKLGWRVIHIIDQRRTWEDKGR